MINDGYLIPANTKSGQLIFGKFTGSDLIIFGVGAGLTLLLLVSLGVQGTLEAIITLAPVGICSFLVLPIPNYRNVRTFVKSAYEFFTNQRIYLWRGWCIYAEQSSETKK